MIGCVLVMIGMVTACGQQVYEKGWVKAMPNVGFVAALPWIAPDGAGMKELHSRLDNGELRQWEYRLLVRRCIRGLENATTPEEKIRLITILANVEERGSASMFVKPYASWSRVSEIDGSRALDALIDLLEDESPDVRMEAIRAIGAFGKAGKAAIPPILGHLNDQGRGSFRGTTREVSLAASIFLAQIDSPGDLIHPPEMVLRKYWAGFYTGQLLTECDREVLGALRAYGTDPHRAISSLFSWLHDNDPNLRLIAAWALSIAAPGDPIVQEQILGLCDDRDMDVRKLAIAYAAQAPVTDRTRRIIGNALADPSAGLRLAGLKSAAVLGDDAACFRKLVLNILDDPHRRWEWAQAAITWVRIGGDPQLASDTIAKLLSGDDSVLGVGDEGIKALDSLIRIGARSPEILDMISRIMEHQSQVDLGCMAAYAYARLGGDRDRATEAIIAEALSKESGRYAKAREYLILLARYDCLGVAPVLKCLDSEDPLQQAVALGVVAPAGARAAPALPRLRALRAASTGNTALVDHAIQRIEWELRHPKEAARVRALQQEELAKSNHEH